MTNVYIDPYSYVHLANILFKEDTIYNRNDRFAGWRYLKKYCFERNMSLNTIDFWKENKATKEDIYVSFDHKDFIRKLYWRFKNKNYPIVKLNKFKKRILFQYEPPLIMPEVYTNINGLLKIYDKIYFSCEIDNQKCYCFHSPRPYNEIMFDYWGNSNRKFLTMININKSPRLFRRLIMWKNKKLLPLQKELLSDRIKIIEFFSLTGDIDLYGIDWDKNPHFPLSFSKKAIQKVYKGPVVSKFQKLSEYKFGIAFENSIVPGFIEEALFDCFYTGTVPIYLGAPNIEKYIPKNCFIDMRDFKNYEELKQYLKALTESEIKIYKENARKFLKSEKFKPFTKEYFAKLFVDAINN